MKHRIARNASAALVGAILICIIPVTNAFALATISSVNPSASPRGVQISNVQINGSAFSSLFTPTVSFGSGIAVSNVRVQSGSVLLVDIDISASAPFGVHTVTVDDGLGSPSSCQCFTVTPPPTISSMSPATLAVGTSAPITFTITGTGFLPNAVVQVSGNAVSAVTQTVASDGKSLTVKLSASSTAVTGSRNVTVMNTDGQSATCSGCVLIVGPPRATGLFPAQRAGGLSDKIIDIVGSGFDNTTTVVFSGSEISIVGSVQRISGTNLRATIHIASGVPLDSHDVTFDNPDNGGHSVCSACFTITGPTSISIATPSTVNGPIVATFSQPVSGVSSSNSFVRFTGHTYNLATTITCADQDGFVTSCATGFVKTASLQPTSNITPGQQYTVHIAESGQPAITDFGGLTVSQATMDFRGGLFQQGEGAATAFTWRTVNTASAFGGSYVVDHVAGASASYRFTGSSITWYTNIGPNYGIADLYVELYQLEPPPKLGHNRVPSSVGKVFGSRMGRPASSKPLAHVCFTYARPAINFPVTRSSTK